MFLLGPKDVMQGKPTAPSGLSVLQEKMDGLERRHSKR